MSRRTIALGLADRFVARQGPRSEELARVPGIAGVGQLPATKAPTETVRSVCGFCATGCSLTVHLRDGRPVNITPTPDYPVNRGSACPKGWESLAATRADDRLRTPLLRGPDGTMQPIDWASAAATFADRMRDVQRRYGAASVAFLSTGQIPTEEMALLGAFAKFEMGVVHGDGNTRQCMATSVVAHKQSFGFDSPPFTYDDLELSDVIVLVGSNLCVAHPILWERIARNPHGPKVIVIDPRRTETAAAGTHHVQPAPATDLALFSALANRLLELGAVDHEFVRAHTFGFDEYAASVEPWTLEAGAAATGVPAEQIDWLAQTIAAGERVSLWWTMGVNQGHQAVRTAQAIINVALMTGNIGRPGTGANSITGQCNAMGSRLFANTTNLLGGRDFTNEAHRHTVAGIIGVDPERIPDQPSKAYDQILEGVEDGSVRALWIIATNTVHSWVQQDRVKAILDRLEFLVVQDLFADTATAAHAHLVLPAAGWGEKDGTFINAERRIGRTRRVADPPGEARSDFDIVRTLAQAWGVGPWMDAWDTPEHVFEILQRLSAGQPCDITGIRGYAHLEQSGIQWPYPEGADDGGAVGGAVRYDTHRRLFADGRFFHPDGRARFITESPEAPPERPSAEHPLVMLTGRRSSSEWHTGTRTSRSAVLRALTPDHTTVQIHPEDARRRDIDDGMTVRVASERGEMTAVASVTTTVPCGQVFVAMHDETTNRLTRWTIDPHSRQPAFKQSCVQVERCR